MSYYYSIYAGDKEGDDYHVYDLDDVRPEHKTAVSILLAAHGGLNTRTRIDGVGVVAEGTNNGPSLFLNGHWIANGSNGDGDD